MDTVIDLTPGWMDASALEDVLRAGPSPHSGQAPEVLFRIAKGCNLMTDAAVRLLSLFNQLDYSTRRVIVDFQDGKEGVLAYLNRIAFFECLSSNVTVLPYRPETSAKRHHGRNPGLVEIQRIDRTHRDQSLLRRLTDAIARACSQRTDVKMLQDAAWTILAELIDNVFSHSQTPLDGFAALQVYPRGNCLKVAVSDSGLGLLETLRPALRSESPRLAGLSNIDLLVEVFRQGLSRHGPTRGCGLKGCADRAIRFHAKLDVRLPQERIFLVPGQGGYAPNKAFCYSSLPLVWGTHVCFTLGLDERA